MIRSWWRARRWRFWRFGVPCGRCGKRSLRSCGARAGERIDFGNGYYKWSKWSPCADHAPGGLVPGIDLLPADGELDDMTDLYQAITERGGIYGGNEADAYREQLGEMHERLSASLDEVARGNVITAEDVLASLDQIRDRIHGEPDPED